MLIPAVEEINSFSDKNVEYEPIKSGRAVSAIRFTITSKDSLVSLRLRSDIEKEFGLDQMTFWDELLEGGYVLPEHGEQN